MTAPYRPLTLKQIQKLTGHASTDAVRMALRRGGVRFTGITVGLSWPPMKIYEADDVWNLFSARILETVTKDEKLRGHCWYYFGYQIREAHAAEVVGGIGDLFADKLQ